MICPAWEDCNKKNCIEESVCMNGDYWSRYWENEKNLNTTRWKDRKKTKKERQDAAIAAYKRMLPACTKKSDTDVCNKQRTCEILGQCIFDIPRFQDKPDLLNALKGITAPKSIINVLREHDPEPMRSWYFKADKKKR